MDLSNNKWLESNTNVFWGELAPCDHVVQIYDNDAIFIDSLAGFVGGGIKSKECVIVIATADHLKALEQRLLTFDINVQELVDDELYIPLEAETTLQKFMVANWPNEELFMNTVTELVNKARSRNRKVRAFGEMVALLWAKGQTGATVNLEHLWNKFCLSNALSLFCAYPKSGFTQDIKESIVGICGCHSKMIAGEHSGLNKVSYRNNTN